MRNIFLIALTFAASHLFAQSNIGGRATGSRQWGTATAMIQQPKAAQSSCQSKAEKSPAYVIPTYTVPYLNTFETEDERDQVEIFDANNDNYTFALVEEYNEDGTLYGYAAHYTFNYQKSADDYLVFPAIELKAGNIYKIAFDSHIFKNSNQVIFPERVELLVGKKCEVGELTTVVIPPTDLKTPGWIPLVRKDFTVETDGTYYFAIHCISDANQAYFLADNFSVKTINPDAPEGVADLQVVADPSGLNKAAVSFTTPTKLYTGEEISGKLNVKVYRGAEVVFNEEKEAGEVVNFIDNVPAPGKYTYTVVASVGEKTGEEESVKVYVGVSIPDVVTNCKAVDCDDKVELSWRAPKKGADGGVVIAEDLRYNIYPTHVTTSGWILPDFQNPYAKGLKDTQYTLNIPTNEGEQTYKFIAITAQNAAGESNEQDAYVLVGAPYEMPLVESSAGGSISYWWGNDMSESILLAGGNVGDGDPADAYDNDGGCMVMNATALGWMEISTGKIAFTDAKNPCLYTHIKSTKSAKVTVTVKTLNNSTTLQTLYITPSGYKQYKLDLSEFAGEKWIRVVFSGIFDQPAKLNIDKTIIAEYAENDIAAAISAPQEITLGGTATAKVTVSNEGEKAVEGYAVKVYADNNILASFEGEEAPALAMFESKEYTVEYKSSILDQAKEVALKVVVDYADSKPENNTAETVIALKSPDVAPVDDVSAKGDAEGATVTWTFVPRDPVEVNEDFEDYDDQVVADGQKLGEWTAYDFDGLDCYGIDASTWYHDEPQAFAVWTPKDYIYGEDYILEHFCRSGKKAVLFPDAIPAGLKKGNNDWMVSPRLPGAAQTIKFYVCSDGVHTEYGKEKFEVCYSTTDTNPDSMNTLYKGEAVPGKWTEISVDLPEGAVYFAIHFVSTNAFFMCVDDISFMASVNPTGYAVYIDGSKVGEVAADAREFHYAGDFEQGRHVAAVTALYGDTESAAVVSPIVTTGISDVAESIEITATNGKIIINGAQQTVVYAADGKRYAEAKGSAVIPVKPGLYIVKADGKVTKVTIR